MKILVVADHSTALSKTAGNLRQGLFDLIKQPDMLASMESALSEPNRLIQVILDDIGRAPQLRAHLHSVPPEITVPSECNFDLPGIK